MYPQPFDIPLSLLNRDATCRPKSLLCAQGKRYLQVALHQPPEERRHGGARRAASAATGLRWPLTAGGLAGHQALEASLFEPFIPV